MSREELRCIIQPLGHLKTYKYVVVCTFYGGKPVLSRHARRDTWETQGGHIEAGETPLEAAKRELYEESGIADADIFPVCDYYGYNSQSHANGMVFAAVAHTVSTLPNFEMKEVKVFDTLPEDLTYPKVTPKLFEEVGRRREIYESRKEGNGMERSIKSMEEKYLAPSLELVDRVFTEYDCAAEGKLVRSLVEEIRSMDRYIRELELIMVDGDDAPIGYCMFSRFHLEGKYENELLLLSPVAVRTDLQRQHISKELIEYGFTRARELGYRAVIVEGNPMNYRSRGFVTSCDYGIVAHESVGLPAPECLMVKALAPGGLEGICGTVSYQEYKCLT